MIEPRYQFVLDGGSLYIHKWMGVASKTVVVPLNTSLMACELLACCKDLLAFIKAHDMEGMWDQGQYPTIRKAKEIVERAENGSEQQIIGL